MREGLGEGRRRSNQELGLAGLILSGFQSVYVRKDFTPVSCAPNKCDAFQAKNVIVVLGWGRPNYGHESSIYLPVMHDSYSLLHPKNPLGLLVGPVAAAMVHVQWQQHGLSWSPFLVGKSITSKMSTTSHDQFREGHGWPATGRWFHGKPIRFA